MRSEAEKEEKGEENRCQIRQCCDGHLASGIWKRNPNARGVENKTEEANTQCVQ